MNVTITRPLTVESLSGHLRFSLMYAISAGVSPRKYGHNFPIFEDAPIIGIILTDTRSCNIYNDICIVIGCTSRQRRSPECQPRHNNRLTGKTPPTEFTPNTVQLGLTYKFTFVHEQMILGCNNNLFTIKTNENHFYFAT